VLVTEGQRPLASISLDLDNLWSYLKVHGDPGWSARPSYLGAFVPRVLDSLDRLGLRITFFIVGVDAAEPAHAEVMRMITARGHEVGNHSYEHDSWLHLYPAAALADDVARAEEAIERATGQRPLGFRGPGFSWSPVLLETLASRGYLYDASTLPTFIGPLARWYFFRSARLSRAERDTRARLFGRFRDGFRDLKPHTLRLGTSMGILEIPVTTMPLVRVPFHLSYLLYLSRVSESGMRAYLRTALRLCRVRGVEPSFLLHPLDLLGADDVRDLAFFPGMDLAGGRKRELFAEVMGEIAARFTAVPMSVHARAVLASGVPERTLHAAV